MRALRHLRTALLGLALLLPNLAHGEGRSIIVLDASGSMWGQIDGRTKIDIAREALTGVLADLPPDTEMGLMAYGHRAKGDCGDIELLVPPASGTGPAIKAAADALQFLGKTPLTDAVRQAALDLRSTEEKATVILITDGVETCQADPCALGRELEASGVDFTAHVVGFGLTAEEGAQVACLAQETGGEYLTAGDLDSLTMALKTTVIAAVIAEPDPVPAPAPAPPPKAALEINLAPTVVLAPGIAKPDGNSGVAWEIYPLAADGTAGERLTTEYNDMKILLDPGAYRLIARIDAVEVAQDLTLVADTLAMPELVLNAARVTLTPRGSEGGAVDASASLNLTNATGMSTTNYGATTLYLPAGEATLLARIGEASVTETLSLTAGQIVERDVIIGSGVAAIEGYYVEGVLIEGSSHAVQVLAAKKSLDGARKVIATNYGAGRTVDLPPGDYLAAVTIGAAHAEVPFTVKIGERVEVAVILNAGVIGVTAPGATSIEILDGKPDLNGNRTSLSFEYVEQTNLTAPAGEFLVVASRDGVMVEQTVTVVPGERSEVALTFP